MKRHQYPWTLSSHLKKKYTFLQFIRNVLTTEKNGKRKLCRVGMKWRNSQRILSVFCCECKSFQHIHTTQKWTQKTNIWPILELLEILNRRSSFHFWLYEFVKAIWMHSKQARQEKKGNNGRIWASPITQECTQVYLLECILAPTWKYKNVLVVV